MCRLLGVVTRAPSPLTDTLSDVLEPFTAQSREHADGWGVAAWHGGEPVVSRGVEPAHASLAYRAALAAPSDAALLHIRMASPGLPVELRNTHPFTMGALAFAHNGFFSPREALDDLIDPEILAGAVGDTDSERYFLRVLTRLRGQDRDPVDAIARTAADIRARASFGSLNCLLLTEDALYAYAEEDPESEVSRRRGPQFFRMHYRVGPSAAMVASQGIPTDGWQLLPYGRVLQIRRGDLRVSIH
ncbi:class II glutamine amidotransferase [Nocardia alni]|uniref:class II glutamine amidotransferase n=1 Tax=Nocardia alni TaxID=2815723 RepID=UPI0020B314CE|nr:class II glutamine amidotransferase [Nocardia alni]